jgi:ADP-heptose:LPS heptosyltransferase
MKVIDLSGALQDFADDAALVSELDLVISIDTALAHLAGALGCSTWTLISHPAEWRWRPEGERSPWYPTMRLFRQQRAGDWDEVVERVALALGELRAATGCSGP